MVNCRGEYINLPNYNVKKWTPRKKSTIIVYNKNTKFCIESKKAAIVGDKQGERTFGNVDYKINNFIFLMRKMVTKVVPYLL